MLGKQGEISMENIALFLFSTVDCLWAMERGNWGQLWCYLSLVCFFHSLPLPYIRSLHFYSHYISICLYAIHISMLFCSCFFFFYPSVSVSLVWPRIVSPNFLTLAFSYRCPSLTLPVIKLLTFLVVSLFINISYLFLLYQSQLLFFLPFSTIIRSSSSHPFLINSLFTSTTFIGASLSFSPYLFLLNPLLLLCSLSSSILLFPLSIPFILIPIFISFS